MTPSDRVWDRSGLGQTPIHGLPSGSGSEREQLLLVSINDCSAAEHRENTRQTCVVLLSSLREQREKPKRTRRCKAITSNQSNKKILQPLFIGALLLLIIPSVVACPCHILSHTSIESCPCSSRDVFETFEKRERERGKTLAITDRLDYSQELSSPFPVLRDDSKSIT